MNPSERTAHRYNELNGYPAHMPPQITVKLEDFDTERDAVKFDNGPGIYMLLALLDRAVACGDIQKIEQ